MEREKSRSDKSLKSSTVSGGEGGGGEGKKRRKRHVIMRQPSQGRSYCAIILHSLLNLAF